VNTSSAHHSVAGFFDPDKLIEIEGVVAGTLWRNPHTGFEVEVTEFSGETTMWRVETGAISVLRARGLDREFLHLGDHVKVYGRESVRGRTEIFADNLGKRISSPGWAVRILGNVYRALVTRDPVLPGRAVGFHHDLHLFRGGGGARLVPWQAQRNKMRVV
jgi:hypothetical protein